MTNRPDHWPHGGPEPRPDDGPERQPEHRSDDGSAHRSNGGSEDRRDRWSDGDSRCDACRTPPPRAARRLRRTARAAALLALALLLAGGAATGCGGRATTHHKPGTSHEQASGSVGTLLTATDATGHRLREVPAQGAPEVEVTVRPDSEDGWNLQLAVKNYRFTPDSTGGAALPGAGHAHLELDGRKLARLYGPWFHLPAAQVPEGAHTLTVRLYADDHTAWAVSGKPVEGTAQLTATATAPGQAGGHSHGESPAPAPAPTSTPTPEQADRTVAITVRDGKVSPAPARTELRRGERVALRVTSDRADTLHVHGYDKELVLPAGQEATLILTVDRTGLFEVETHESNLVLTQLLVR
ncbi:hypothetical protein [Streptomyces sp. NPDC059566]|uniref:hypothetical protein n=1 Tax=Streptomyces sp. NPDC059566 TaxID=3346866 RepID=UPI0036ABBFEE